MKNMKEAILTPVLKFLTNRLLFLIVGVCIAFYILAAQLFNLQIVNGHIHQAEFSETVANPVAIKAQRGTIYDRYGRPLAVNEFAYAVTID
ncbi:MAG: hypothetical protein LBU94_03245, partial [Clostridiales bacterium]|nr:hypothetical protein [Clostridiales bacterium]